MTASCTIDTPLAHGLDNFVGIGRPCEGLRFGVMFDDEAIDCSLQVGHPIMKGRGPRSAECDSFSDSRRLAPISFL